MEVVSLEALAAIPLITEKRYHPTATSVLSSSITDKEHLDSFTLEMKECQMVKIGLCLLFFFSFTLQKRLNVLWSLSTKNKRSQTN